MINLAINHCSFNGSELYYFYENKQIITFKRMLRGVLKYKIKEALSMSQPNGTL